MAMNPAWLLLPPGCRRRGDEPEKRCCIFGYLRQVRETFPEASEKGQSVFSKISKKNTASMFSCKLFFLITMNFMQEMTVYPLVRTISNQKCKRDPYSFHKLLQPELTSPSSKIFPISTIALSLQFYTNSRGSVSTTQKINHHFPPPLQPLLPPALADASLRGEPTHPGDKEHLFMILQHFPPLYQHQDASVNVIALSG